MTRFWDGRTDGRTDGRSDCTPRPAFAFGDAGKNYPVSDTHHILRQTLLTSVNCNHMRQSIITLFMM